MEIRYQREIRHNYLIIRGNDRGEDYEMRMAEENCIGGLLPFCVKEMEDGKEFYYEITSRQPLSRMVERKPISGEELRHLILGIAGAAAEMEKYLLSEKNILLEPDYIYIEPQSYAVSLCFIPGYVGSFPDETGKLMEYLLGKVSHDDREGVVLAYELFQATRQENYGIADLLRILYQPDRRERENEPPDGPAWKAEQGKQTENPYGVYPDRRNREKKSLLDRFRKKKKDETPWQMAFPDEDEEMSAGSERKFRPEAGVYQEFGRRGEMADSQEIGGQAELNSRREFAARAESTGYRKFAARAESAGHREFGSRAEAAGRHPEILQGKDTAVLQNGSGQAERRLVSLSGDGEIEISYFPFLLGKQEGLVDYVVAQDTVSRLHARIDREDGEYTITDLNSTNGIQVDGRLLQTNETASLPVGSEIYLADVGFLFL